MLPACCSRYCKPKRVLPLLLLLTTPLNLPLHVQPEAARTEAQVNEVATWLQRHAAEFPFFIGTPKVVLRELARVMEVEQYHNKEVVFEEGVRRYCLRTRGHAQASTTLRG